MSTDGSTGGVDRIDRRLARLAPTSAPDPTRLASARTALETAIDDEATAGGHRTSGPDGAHVVDLVDDRVRVDVVGGPPRPRPRSRRRLTLAAAAAGIVVVGAGVLLVSPGPDVGPAVPGGSCEDRLTAETVPDGFDADLSWRTIAHESWPTADLTLLVTEDGRLSGFCAIGDGPTTTTVWPTASSTVPAPDEVLPRGVELRGWSVLWGVAGEDVESVEVQAEWPDEAGSGPHSSDRGVLAEARLASDGTWSSFLGPSTGENAVPDDAEVTLVAHLADGSTRSTPLDDAWDEPEADTDTDSAALTDARRSACSAGWRGQGNRPVLEVRREDHGVTMIADPRRGWFAACVQDADAPYAPLVDMSGELPAEDPAPDEAIPSSGAASGGAAALVGVAGADVARVEVTTSDGARVDADLSDGYWVAWGADLGGSDGTQAERDAGPWDGATLTWYDVDDSELGSEPVFP